MVPTLEPGQVVVMDNATFHSCERIQQLIHDAGCELLYLPPYSPDLNKIEKCWSWLKSQIRKKLEKFDCLRDAPIACLTFCVLIALAVATTKTSCNTARLRVKGFNIPL